MTRRMEIACLVTCIIVCAGRTRGGQERLSREDQALLLRAEQTSKAFALAANKVAPAVIHIQVEATVVVPGGAGLNDPFGMFDERLFPHLFRRRSRRYRTQGQGSGVIVDQRGYALTNNHVVGEAEKITVKLGDGRVFSARKVGTDPQSDVAVIQVEGDNLPVAELGDSDAVRVGEWVLAVGNPFGLDHTVTSGIISAKGRSNVVGIEYEDFIQTDAAINPGNSGGPLADIRGRVIGINTAIFSKSGGYQGIGFSIPINMAKAIMDELITGKTPTRPFLGASFQDLDENLIHHFKLDRPGGALVSQVMPNSPAQAAGIKAGDIIVSFRGARVTGKRHLSSRIATSPLDKPVEVKIYRDGTFRELTVRLAATPEAVAITKEGKRILEELGIEVRPLTPKLAARLGYEDLSGLVVVSVRRGGAGAYYGLRPGSLIQKVGQKEVKTTEELVTVLGRATHDGSAVLLIRTGRFLQQLRLTFE